MKRIIFTRHAEERSAARHIRRESIERVLERPLWTEPDPIDSSLTRAYGWPEAERRHMLKVVFRVMDDGGLLVVTAHFDRTAAHGKPR